MDWIKKNYDRFTLAVFSAALLGVAVMMFMNTGSFGDRFSAAMASPAHNNTIPAVDTAVIDDARRQLENPTIWKERNDENDANGGLVFTSIRYQEEKGVLTAVTKGYNWKHSRLGTGIPNTWVIDHGFSILDPDQAKRDTDGDGFWNEDEWLFKTDPNKKEDHPPYHYVLYLKEWVKVPFRLKFQAYDGTPDKMAEMTFQINTLDLRQPSEFLKIGEVVSKTNFKIIKYEHKEKKNESTGEMEDVSELTLENQETKEPVVLILDKIVDSPNQFAKLNYYLVGKDISDGVTPFEFSVAKLRPFVLRPDITVRYKLLDVSKDEAVIQLPDGTTTYKVVPYSGKKPGAAPAPAPAAPAPAAVPAPPTPPAPAPPQ